VPLPAALTTKTPHDFAEFLMEGVGVAGEWRGSTAALLCEAFNQYERFFSMIR